MLLCQSARMRQQEQMLCQVAQWAILQEGTHSRTWHSWRDWLHSFQRWSTGDTADCSAPSIPSAVASMMSSLTSAFDLHACSRVLWSPR